MKKDKRNSIINILIVLVVLAIIAIAVWMIISKKEPAQNGNTNTAPGTSEKQTSKEAIEEKLKQMNEINQLFNTDEIDKNDSYPNEYDELCYAYTGDYDEMVEKIESIYYDDVDDILEYELVRSSRKNKIYFCVPSDCEKINEIDYKNFEIVEEEEDSIFIKVGDAEHKVRKDGDSWQFIYPIIICEE